MCGLFRHKSKKNPAEGDKHRPKNASPNGRDTHRNSRLMAKNPNEAGSSSQTPGVSTRSNVPSPQSFNPPSHPPVSSPHALNDSPQPRISTSRSRATSSRLRAPSPPSLLLSPSTTSRPSKFVGAEIDESTKTTVSTSGLWSRAYSELDINSQNCILNNAEVRGKSDEKWTEELVSLVREKEEACKNSMSKVGNREVVILGDYANQTVEWLEKIGKIANTFAPQPSPIIWSALKTLMNACVAQFEDTVALFGCAEKVLIHMRMGTVYEIAYLRDAPHNPATEILNLEKTIVELYKALLQLLVYALELLNEKRGRQFFDALISPRSSSKEHLLAVSKSEKKLSKAVQACSVVESQERHRELLQSLGAPLELMEENMAALIKYFEEEDLDKALEFISTISIGDHHLEKTKTRTPKTCEWLLNDRRFLEWERSEYSSTLWLQGNIGTGKSYLTSKVIDRYWPIHERRARCYEGFAYYYCSRSDPSRRDPESIYKSYIRQLARMHHDPAEMRRYISNLRHNARQEHRSKLNIGECKTTLSELLKSFRQTTLVLDALDECETQARREIILNLRSLAEGAKYPVKVYFASRREPDIENFLGSGHVIKIRKEDNEKDVEEYIQEEMNQQGGVWELVSERVKSTVKNTITSQSQGIFRWAFLQLEQLKELKNTQSIQERLGRLPKRLEREYDEIYSKNERSDAAILQRVVKWVLSAQEPLSSEVLLAAIRLEARQESEIGAALIVSNPITQSTLESICCNLVVRDSQLKVWRFPHASVAEYFESRHKDWAGNAREDVAVLLISYLIDCYSEWAIPQGIDNRSDPWSFRNELHPDDYLDPRHPFQEYARRYWAWHAQRSPIPSRVSPVLKRFLGAKGLQYTSSPQYQLWCRHVDRVYIENHGLRSVYIDDMLPAEKSILGICALGLHPLLEGWWDQDIDLSQTNSKRMDLPLIAARNGHHDLCSILLEDHCEKDGHRHPLVTAIALGEQDMAADLLCSGYNPNEISWEGSSILCYCAQNRSTWAVEMLLKAQANPNIECQDRCGYNRALHAALWNGDIKSAKMLIDSNADIQQSGEDFYGSPLNMAAAGGSIESVKLLMRYGADVNAQLNFGEFGSVLFAAIFSWKRDLRMIQYLIEEAGTDTTILSLNPRWKSIRYRERDLRCIRRKVGYLIERGYIRAEDIPNPRLMS